MRFLAVILLAATCKRASNAPIQVVGAVTAKDTLRDTIVLTAKLHDTVRLQNTQLITRFDTQTQTLRITQLLSVPVVRDTIKQLVVLPQVQQASPAEQKKKKMGFWGWVDLFVTALLVLLSLLLLYVVLRTFVL